MRAWFASLQEWYRPRKRHSLWGRCWRNCAIMLPVWPVGHLLWHGPWYEGIDSVIWLSLCYSLAEYGYFHVFGGTDEEYPKLPEGNLLAVRTEEYFRERGQRGDIARAKQTLNRAGRGTAPIAGDDSA